eukprot:jgi/Mesvir1/16261/Mv08507-RA.1
MASAMCCRAVGTLHSGEFVNCGSQHNWRVNKLPQRAISCRQFTYPGSFNGSADAKRIQTSFPEHLARVAPCRLLSLKQQTHGGKHRGTVCQASGSSQAIPSPESAGEPALTPQAKLARSIAGLLPYTVATTVVVSLLHPPSFAWFQPEDYSTALGFIMLSVGVKLRVEDFAKVFQAPAPVAVGLALQYVFKPLSCILIAHVFRLSPDLAGGLILTSCVAGAQLSSYAAFLSHGDVALAIVLTALTTVFSIVCTPVLAKLCIGSLIPVNMGAMALSILKVVVLPISIGLLLNKFAKPLLDRVEVLLPVVAMVATSLCIGSPLARNGVQVLSQMGLVVVAPVVLWHLVLLGGSIALTSHPVFKFPRKVWQPLSLCTLMQSSTLAMFLAQQQFGAVASIPPTVSVVVMALLGLFVATMWGNDFAKESEDTPCSVDPDDVYGSDCYEPEKKDPRRIVL